MQEKIFNFKTIALAIIFAVFIVFTISCGTVPDDSSVAGESRKNYEIIQISPGIIKVAVLKGEIIKEGGSYYGHGGAFDGALAEVSMTYEIRSFMPVQWYRWADEGSFTKEIYLLVEEYR